MRHYLIACITASALCVTSVTHAQMDVDDADSLRFQSFHEKKDSGIKVYDSKKGGLQIGESKETQKVYQQPAAAKTTTTTTAPATNAAQAVAPAAAATVSAAPSPEYTNDLPQGKKGQRFEIRERYSLKPYSTNTAASAIEAAYRQMAGICSNGWEVIREFSVPVEGDFYKHYEFDCL